MNRTRAISFVLLALVTEATLLAACQPGAAGPSRALDPRQAVSAALASTAALDSVHAIVRIDLLDGSGKRYSATIEGDVNVASREFDLSATLEPPAFGTGAARIVRTDGFVFTNANGAWSVSGGLGSDPLEFVPTTAQAATTIGAAIQDPSTTVTLDGTESCAETTCMRIRAVVPPEVAWRALNALSSPAADPTRSQAPAPAGFPGVAIDLWIEQDTLRLRQASNVTKVGGQSVSITISLTRHGEAVNIVRPIRS